MASSEHDQVINETHEFALRFLDDFIKTAQTLVASLPMPQQVLSAGKDFVPLPRRRRFPFPIHLRRQSRLLLHHQTISPARQAGPTDNTELGPSD